MPNREEKLLVGPRLRRFRQTMGLTQSRMAEDLGISTSYLNLMERNQRPLSAKVLLRMAEIYDFDISNFTGSGDAHLVAELYEAFRDPFFKDETLSKNEAEDIVNTSPGAARSFLKLYNKHREQARRQGAGAALALGPDTVSNDARTGGEGNDESATEAVEWVRRFIHKERNYFPRLDAAAEALSEELGLSKHQPHLALTERLKDKHGLSVKIMPIDVMPQMLRYFDRHSKRINLSELLRQSGRRFQLAFQIGMLEHRPLIDDIVKKAQFSGVEAQRLLRTSLANYFAAATLMPYRQFLKEAESTKYDVDLLSHRFGTSFEQTAHRLTTLQNPQARGIPFFFVRIDVAGNISKRFSSGRFHISQFGGACPLWNVHECFQTPGKTITQMVQMPDETTYFSIARMVSRSDGTFNAPEQRLAIGLGCDVAYAPRLTYAQHYNLAEARPTPIGVNCFLCERQHCRQRAHAPLNKRLSFDERARGMSLYRFDDS
jgi:predicted transcriptional regulator/transcriptional regulator with XRE-family HTH domain